jgi:hypothetical protein
MSTPTTAEHTPEVESDPTLDHPWALWAAFRGIRSWFFRRGLPPTLDHPRFVVRLLRMFTMMAALGMASVLATMGAMGLEQVLDASGVNWSFKGMSLMFLPGVWFGLCVLVPLSRWQGRSWWLTIPAVPVSAGLFWCGVLSFMTFAPIMSSSSDRSLPLAGLVSGCVGGFGLALWMNPPRTSRALAVIAATVLAAIFGAECFAFLFHDGPPSTWLPEPLHRLLSVAALFGPFHVSVAMALGLRLVNEHNRESSGPISP